ncbi:hypothetical protein [Vreelandella populi]|uniref:hypothetical protein n=1 Tax=Vreelandella populi TaxID=2498858 RepID=UPI000F8DF930|nr:hypothetical protein [Halomonas populi]RUR38517.1 hypothetical protein ELY25_09135 [Halomonas populi]
MNIHESMEQYKSLNSVGDKSLEGHIDVEAAIPGAPECAVVLEILGDGEAHTIDTIDSYLQYDGIDISGCQIAACILRLHLDGHQIQPLGPYDLFGCAERFKLVKQSEDGKRGAL